jgi:hypothetical protein
LAALMAVGAVVTVTDNPRLSPDEVAALIYVFSLAVSRCLEVSRADVQAFECGEVARHHLAAPDPERWREQPVFNASSSGPGATYVPLSSWY